MRKLVALVVLLLLATMVGSAYSRAWVWNDVKQSVVSTDSAVAKLTCKDGVGNKDGACYTGIDGQLHLDFSRSKDGSRGVQPWSRYQWDALFTLQNVSNEHIKYELGVTAGKCPYMNIWKRSGETNYGAPAVQMTKDGVGTGAALELATGESAEFSVELSVPKDGKMEDFNCELEVRLTAM